MRVAHIITRMIVGGAQENTLFNCLDLQRDYGDEVLLITGPALGPEGDLLVREKDVIQQLRIEYVQRLCREINPIKDLQAFLALRQRLKEFAPDVVHTHSAKAGVLGRAAASSLGVPAVVHTIHGAPFHAYQSAISRRVFQIAERWAATRCSRMISVADAMTDLMVDAGVASPSKFTTIYSGMNVEPFLESSRYRETVRREFGLEEHHVVIGKIARLFHLKGHYDVIQAAKEVVLEIPDVRFLFVGNGVLKQSLESEIQDSGLQEHFIFTGLVDPVEVPRLIAAMDIVVHASYREGLARALPQALISGIPVVSYDIDGAREVVINGQTGSLIPPGDIRELSNAMTSLGKDPALRTQYGLAGRKRFTEQFRHQEMTRQIRALYQDLLGKVD